MFACGPLFRALLLSVAIFANAVATEENFFHLKKKASEKILIGVETAKSFQTADCKDYFIVTATVLSTGPHQTLEQGAFVYFTTYTKSADASCEDEDVPAPPMVVAGWCGLAFMDTVEGSPAGTLQLAAHEESLQPLPADMCIFNLFSDKNAEAGAIATYRKNTDRDRGKQEERGHRVRNLRAN